VIFADEPTGVLDTRTGREAMDALLVAAADANASVLVVTHDRELAGATAAHHRDPGRPARDRPSRARR
jgi:ABC-type lipoprotein export system ATPase subunit